MPGGFLNDLEIVPKVLNVLERPEFFSVESLYTMFHRVMSTLS